MKRTLLFLALPFLLVGCAQLFDANVFAGVDTPPPLDLKKSSPADLKSQAADPSFVQRLKEDPKQLKAAQDVLATAMEDPNATSEDILAAGSTLVELSASASGVADMKADAIKNVSSIKDYISNGQYAKALKLFMGGQSAAEIKATLDNLSIMANALKLMQATSAKDDGTIDSDKFFSGATDAASFALSALMAAIAHALIADSGDSATLAADLSLDEPTASNSGVDMTKFLDAKNASSPSTFKVSAAYSTASQYSYSYVAILKDKLAISL